MNSAIENFLHELRADQRTAGAAETCGAALRAMDFEADGNADAAGMIEVISTIVRGDEPLDAKIKALAKLCDFDGRVVMTMDEMVLLLPRNGQPKDY